MKDGQGSSRFGLGREVARRALVDMSRDAGLGLEDREAFRRDGYLVKRAVLDPESCARAVDRVWTFLPPSFDRDNHRTWRGTLTDCNGTKSMRRRKGRFKIREQVWSEPWLLQFLPLHPTVFSIAEQLLGPGSVAAPSRIRGLYPIFPTRRILRNHPTGHVDRHVYQLGVIAYLDQVDAGEGAFTLWPGSHRLFYYDFTTHAGIQPGPSLVRHLDAYKRRRKSAIEIPGGLGDVIFYHHRLLHAAGRNRGYRVRQGALAEFIRGDLENTRNEPPDDDMWRHWSLARSSLPSARTQ